VEEIMARKQNNDLLMEDELAAAFFSEDDQPIDEPTVDQTQDEGWDGADEDFPGQLAVDVYETADKLVIKARTAGVDKKDLDVSISDNILTVSGTLSSGEDASATNWHLQECYWGEFSRTIALPVQVREEDVEAVLKDGVLTITFTKVQPQKATVIKVQ
jgi:HSP20 family protein